MIRPWSRIAKTIMTITTLTAPRIELCIAPRVIPAASRTRITAAMTMMYASASGSMNFQPSDISWS